MLLVCGFATVSAATGVRHRDANQVGKGTPTVKGSLGVHVDRVSLDAGYLGTNETAAEEAAEAPRLRKRRRRPVKTTRKLRGPPRKLLSLPRKPPSPPRKLPSLPQKLQVSPPIMQLRTTTSLW